MAKSKKIETLLHVSVDLTEGGLLTGVAYIETSDGAKRLGLIVTEEVATSTHLDMVIPVDGYVVDSLPFPVEAPIEETPVEPVQEVQQ